MLLVNTDNYPPHLANFAYFNNRLPTPPLETQFNNWYSMGYHPDVHVTGFQVTGSNEVAQALEVARESPEGAKDPVISNILETALAEIWGKIMAQPNSYIMSRDEFAVFNFFQNRFKGNKIAVEARRRYWDNTFAV